LNGVKKPHEIVGGEARKRMTSLTEQTGIPSSTTERNKKRARKRRPNHPKKSIFCLRKEWNIGKGNRKTLFTANHMGEKNGSNKERGVFGEHWADGFKYRKAIGKWWKK